MTDGDELERTLRRIDGRGYKAYRDLRGRFAFGGIELHVDHVQGDPFAAPSRMRLRVATREAAFPPELHAGRPRRLAFADYLARRVAGAVADRGRGAGRRGRGGEIGIDAGRQQVLERSAIRFGPDWIEARLEVGLPAAGRRVLGAEAVELLCRDLPAIADASLRWRSTPRGEALHFVEQIENQESLREQLAARGLIAFVGDGAVLPRASGASDLPLEDGVTPFRSPPTWRVRLPLANPVEGPEGVRREVTGMGIGTGVTLVVGGGYHGKSTLLRALERAVHPHVPGDGREWVVSRRDLVKIRAEDGRRVERVDISAFVDRLPGDRSTRAFTSEDASGSTSQAANIAEAIEVGAGGLLLDEDTSATNFMVRDARMQALVHRDLEPITPFLERVREIHDEHGVSTVLVMGGSGDYFDVADRVLLMREFEPADVTREAQEVAASHPTGRRPEARPQPLVRGERCPDPASVDASRGSREVAIDARGTDAIRFGRDEIDLRQVEQLLDPSQTRAVGCAIRYAALHLMGSEKPLRDVLGALDTILDREGLDLLDPHHRPERHPGRLARPRPFEIAAALNRLRSLRVSRRGDS